jgi:hypothetical protein
MNSQRPDRRRRFYLLDAAALVVGYSLASLLVRAFGSALDNPSVGTVFVLGLAFLWLGLAMSGPVVLLGHRRGPDTNGGDDDGPPPDSDLPAPRTWAEIAWLIIGFYWITLTVLVVPARLHSTRVLDSAFLGLFPILAAIALRILRPSGVFGPAPAGVRDWTHHVAVVLLVTWPFAWVAMILLGTTLP